MRKSPIIKPLNKDSGTLYVFQSSSDLLTRTISGSNFDIKFDRFALLELPKIGNSSNQNSILLSGIGSNQNQHISSVPIIGGLNADKNIELATAFQNYCLAFENEILSNQTEQEYTTSSERIWWKFLSTTNAIKFREGLNSEINSNYSIDNFLEGDLQNPYNQVVKYIGLTEGVNVSNLNNMTSSEIFINVGSNIKKIDKTFFKKTLSNSYKSQSLNSEFISGFDTSNQRVYLDGNAWFDDSSNKSWNINNSKFIPESYEAQYSNTNIQHQQINRTKSDIAEIDWNSNLYGSNTISEIPGREEDFKFNCVLIYYTILVNGQEYTNLYGVYFTGGFDFNSQELKSKLKIVPKLQFGESGNSYNFKIQLRVESHSGQNNLVSVDNGTSAIQLFNSLLAPLRINELNLKSSLKQILKLNSEIDSLNTKLNSILSLRNTLIQEIQNISTDQNLFLKLNELTQEINWLKRQISAEPINLIYDRGLDVQNLSSGQKIIQVVSGLKNCSLNLNYAPGNGLTLNTSNSNIIQLLNTGSRIILDIPTGCEELILNLKKPSSNFFQGYVIRIKNNTIIENGVLKVNLIDEETQISNFITSIYFTELNKPIELICSNLSPIQFEIDKF